MTLPDPLGGPDTAFQQHLASGRFMIQRGVRTGIHVFHPRSVAPGTGEDLEWVEASGLGTIYSATVIRKRPPEAPASIVLVTLDEGPRMMSRVDDMPADDVRIGMRVRARICESSVEPGIFLVTFVPLEETR